MNRFRGAITGSPLLLGSAATLLTVTIVFLAYIANSGLPFAPSYRLNAEVPNAANLVKGNEVRLGGTRVGVVDDISPVRHPNGSVTARLHLKLSPKIKPLPADSTLIIRPRSVLGLKYVELTKGTSSESLAEGKTIALAQARPEPVEIDQVFSTFDEPTRTAVATAITELGNTFAGRGKNINDTLERLPKLLEHLQPVAATLADRRNRLPAFINGLAYLADELSLSPTATADLVRNLDTTLAVFARRNAELGAAIANAAPLLNEGIRSFPLQRPFLRDATLLASQLKPSTALLAKTAPYLAQVGRDGPDGIRSINAFSDRLPAVLKSFETIANDPLAVLGVQGLTTTADILQPTVRKLTPAQTTCNYVSLAFRNLASILSEGDSNGTWQKFVIVSPSVSSDLKLGPNSEASPSSAPADGPSDGAKFDNYLRANPYPNANEQECEAGNQPFERGRQSIGNPSGNQSNKTEVTTEQQGGKNR